MAIPITELRLGWRYQVTEMLGLGLGASTATWRDVPVPPGHAPIAGGDELLEEDTIVLFGLELAIELRF